MNEEARIEYKYNHNIPNVIDLLGCISWLNTDDRTTDCMKEQLVGEYLEMIYYERTLDIWNRIRRYGKERK